jgi:hypothetical protein
MKETGITCEFEIKCPETMKFSDSDLSSLIGNILDNAREACEHSSTRKYVQLKLVYFNHSLVGSCENSTDSKVTTLTTRKKKQEQPWLWPKINPPNRREVPWKSKLHD